MEIKTRELCENGKIEKIANAVFDKNINGSEYEQKKRKIDVIRNTRHFFHCE